MPIFRVLRTFQAWGPGVQDWLSLFLYLRSLPCAPPSLHPKRYAPFVELNPKPYIYKFRDGLSCVFFCQIPPRFGVQMPNLKSPQFQAFFRLTKAFIQKSVVPNILVSMSFSFKV